MKRIARKHRKAQYGDPVQTKNSPRQRRIALIIVEPVMFVWGVIGRCGG
jgi:glutamate-1-semialdehyde aminotransferase